MTLNVEKTYEMIVRGKTQTSVPSCIPSIERKTWLKLFLLSEMGMLQKSQILKR